MDADGLAQVFVLLLHWRVTVSLIASSALAIALVQMLPWLTGLQGIAIALAGFFPGAIWESTATNAPSTRSGGPVNETSILVSALASVIVGSIWGIFSSTSLHAFLAGAILFSVFALLWAWYVVRIKKWVNTARAKVCCFVAAVAYLATYVIAR
ncbi:hypothetical protein [Accumulibacter sp.]|uniref:hypothetical protein n=1 Tax=Accumulibacter sp. TaxID=2053492 RepID=UPI00260458F8|nr:hypothetical protein [Accumulibacter sp.]